jgi:ABC-type molybdate transport system ATPase subunit
MYDPAIDLVLLKKLCKELQKEIAYSSVDRDEVYRLADDIEHLTQRIKQWSKE